jgi:hypothetical protein
MRHRKEASIALAARMRRHRFAWLSIALAALLLTPAGADARATHGTRLTLSTASQNTILSTGSMNLRVAYRTGGTGPAPMVHVVQYETTGGTIGRTTALTRRRRIQSPGLVTVPLSHAGVRTLSLCAARRIVVELTLRRRVIGASASTLNVDAPHCQRFFSPTSFWNAPLAAAAPLDPSSPTITSALLKLVNSERATHFGPSINTTQYSTPIYTVPSSQPLTPVVLDRYQPYAAPLRQKLADGVPIPPGAQAALGSDEHLVVWQPASDKMWELWHAHLVGSTWHADWGGYMSHVDSDYGVFPGGKVVPWGATATGMPLLGGLVTLADLRRGFIDHALAFALPDTRALYWSLPAQRTDGGMSGPNTIPEGAQFRLPATLDIASLGLPPLVRMIADAAQKYGMFLRDTSATTTFYGEDPMPTGSGAWTAAFGGATPGSLMALFPWHDLVLLKMTLQTYRH